MIAVLGTNPLARRFAAAALEAGRSVALYGDPNAVVDAIEGLSVDGDIDGTTDLAAAVADASVVLDTRDHDDPQRALADVEAAAPPEATLLIASDGSVTAAAAGCRDPGRVLGVSRLEAAEELIELVATEHTGEAITEETRALFETLGVAVVTVRDVPGGIGRRLELALEREAMLALEEGVGTPSAIDRTMETAFGHAEGPLARADRVGLERRLETFQSLAAYLGERFDPPEILEAHVAAGATGRSAGRGFYAYEEGTAVDPPTTDPTEHSDRPR